MHEKDEYLIHKTMELINIVEDTLESSLFSLISYALSLTLTIIIMLEICAFDGERLLYMAENTLSAEKFVLA